VNLIDFKRHRFPPAVILRAVRWYFRFTLSIRDVEELMAERGIEASRETVRCWVINHGPIYNAFNLQPHLISRPGLRVLRSHAEAAWAAATQTA